VRETSLVPIIALLLSLVWAGACGNAASSGGKPGTPPGTSMLKVTGTSDGVSHTLNLTLTLN
jgi:hypothetical protein